MFSEYKWADAFSNFLSSLSVMWQAMLGIFLVMAVLIVSIVLLSFFSERAARKKEAADGEQEPQDRSSS